MSVSMTQSWDTLMDRANGIRKEGSLQCVTQNMNYGHEQQEAEQSGLQRASVGSGKLSSAR